ncbi:MAG: NADH-quinone oxidoreductase subunit M, partial [Candidatus Nephrothrix sp. EaCA]
MLGLVVSGNLLLTFCFWELVGFSSYLLIGHWRFKPQAAYAATLSFLVNRLADAGFIIALALLWKDNGSLEYSDLLEHTQSATAFILLFIGVMGKSAQQPFSGWLLHAMEGPTPASALIHSATMVAAGVYLLVIISPIIPPPA